MSTTYRACTERPLFPLVALVQGIDLQEPREGFMDLQEAPDRPHSTWFVASTQYRCSFPGSSLLANIMCKAPVSKKRGLLDSRSEEAQSLGLSPCNAGLPEDVNNRREDCRMRPASATLHGFKSVQGVAPLAALFVGADQIRVGHSIGVAVVLGHALEHEAGLVILAAMGAGSYHAVEDAHIWLAAL